MNHDEVLHLKDGDRVYATRDGGAIDRPRYQKGDVGTVRRHELSCPSIERDDGTSLGFVSWRKWELTVPKITKKDRRYKDTVTADVFR